MLTCAVSSRFRTEDLRKMNCDLLYGLFNNIYAENGFCSATAHSSLGCKYDKIDEVPLNAYERANVATIVSVERGKNCPR